MRRRKFLQHSLFFASMPLEARCRASSASKPPRRTSQPSGLFQLSQAGCGRATGYAETNKIISHDGKTHVAWLDSEKKSFRVKVRTLDHASKSWSKTCTVGTAYDNHGGPALAIDSKGYLHIVYHPHHHPFRYRKSLRPNDASAWSEEQRFGKRCTYPTMLCGDDDTLYVTCRESAPQPWHVNLYTKKPDADAWAGPMPLLRSGSDTGYSHFQEALAWGPDHRQLHLSCRFYNGTPGRGHTVGYLKSPDRGKTWQRLDGAKVELPASPKEVSVICRETEGNLPGLRCGAIAVDRNGTSHILYSSFSRYPGEAFLAVPRSSGKWKHTALSPFLPSAWKGWTPSMPGGVTIDEHGRIIIVLTIQRYDPETPASSWGNPSSEVIQMLSRDGGRRFQTKSISSPDPDNPHWLPNLERSTGHNKVNDPSLIFTSGTRGENNRQIVANRVFWTCISDNS